MTGPAADREVDARSLRVLHLDHTSAAGGAEFALVRMLSADPPWTPLVLVPPREQDGVFAALSGRVPVRGVGVDQPHGVSRSGVLSLFPAATSLAVQALLTRVHRGFREADIVDANSARAAAYGALAARTSRKPLVVHLRDFVDRDAVGRFGHAMMTRVVLPRADGVIANSAATLETARPWLRADAVTAVIPSAAGLETVERTPTTSAARGAAPLTIGMLARIDPWKGQLLLLEAFAEAFADGDEVLEFAGSAPFGHERFLGELHQRAAALGVDGRVVFHGHVDDTQRLLAGWDIAVQASLRAEPLGQNVLQYLAAGCATVVADEGGPREWVEHARNGLRFPPRDGRALAGVLAQLAGDRALRERLSAAAARTTGLLTDHDVARAHAEVFDAVISRR